MVFRDAGGLSLSVGDGERSKSGGAGAPGDGRIAAWEVREAGC